MGSTEARGLRSHAGVLLVPLNKQLCEIYPQTITDTLWRPKGR